MDSLFKTAKWQTIKIDEVIKHTPRFSTVVTDNGKSLTFEIIPSHNSSIAKLMLEVGETIRLLVDGSRIIGMGHKNPCIHPLVLEVLKAFGTDIDGLIKWATSPIIWCQDDQYEEKPDPRCVIDDNDHIQMVIGMADYTIFHEEIRISDRLPETLVNACIGKPLRNIISIPELDHLEIPVINVKTSFFGTIFTIIPKGEMVLLL